MVRVSLTACAAVALILSMAGASHALPSRFDDYSSDDEAPSGPHWLLDERAQCWAYDSNAGAYDTITWSGVCRDGRADGPGTLTFFHRGRRFEELTGTFDAGHLEDGHVSIRWSDGSQYDGDEAGGQFNGRGRLIASDGTRYDGEWRNDRFVDSGDRSSNSDQEADEEENDVPGGSSESYVDNAPRSAEAAPSNDDVPPVQDAPEPSTPPTEGSAPPAPRPTETNRPVQAAVQRSSVSTEAKKEEAATRAPASAERAAAWTLFPGSRADLVAADGSKLALSLEEGGVLAREHTAADGTVVKSELELLGDHIGTVEDDKGDVAATFHLNGRTLSIDYADGKTDTLRANADGAWSETAQLPGEKPVETSWFPSGHVFAQEKPVSAPESVRAQPAAHHHNAPVHIAVAARVASAREDSKPLQAAVPQPAIEPQPKPADIATTDPASEAHLAEREKDSAEEASKLAQSLPRPEPKPLLHLNVKQGKHHKTRKDRRTEIAVAAPAVSAPPAPVPVPHSEAPLPAVTTVVVRNSEVHMIDGVETPPMRRSASECLTVESNGTHWGFRNNCVTDIQFAYCVMNATNRLTACGQSAVPGSVSGHGFSALVADLSLKDQNTSHQFRWIGCIGGAGEVVPRLDQADPPLGRCLHETDLPQGSEHAEARRMRN